MTERDALSDPNETPEDVATLYSWANLHGAKYRDFSASRAQSREKAQERVEQVMEKERLKARQDTEAARIAAATRAEEERDRAAELAAEQAARLATQETARQAALEAAQELARQQAAKQGAQHAAQQAALHAVQQAEAAQHAAQRAQAAQLAAQQAEAAQHAAQQAQAAQLAAQQAEAAPHAPQQTAWRIPRFDRPTPPETPSYPPQASPAPNVPLREESYTPTRSPWISPDTRESGGRPAWLMPERAETASEPVLPPAPDETLQESRDRLASRWYALQGVFEGSVPPAQAVQAPVLARPPVLAVFSLAGGVGKTSIVATLGRALSARGERVLLVDSAPYGLMPFFFGARDQRPGQLRTFSPPMASGDAAIQMITLDPDAMGPETGSQEALTAEISLHARGLGRVIVDLATASGATTRRVMRLAPQVLVPLVPDLNSVVSVSSIDAFFDHNGGASGKPALPHYVLNQFDPSLPLHLDVREVLRERLGDRLLPFALRRSPAVSEALAEGMTIMDYAPNSAVAEDFASLAGWVKSLSAPAGTGFRGVRWSER
jgi:cellulose synthase operon protein YhjQ